jgi:hypothetical protein
MPLAINEIHLPSSPTLLNEEWFVVENTGDKPFSTNGCAVMIGRGSSRLRQVGTLDPGFTLAPGEKVRIVTGNPGKKAHGAPPTKPEALKNYHLFGGVGLIDGKGSVIALALKQHELARAAFDPSVKTGVAKEAKEAKE